MDLKLPKMLCKDSKQHHVMFHELNSVSSLLCIAQNVRFEIPYKDLYFETPFLMIFKYYAWASCGSTGFRSHIESKLCLEYQNVHTNNSTDNAFPRETMFSH